MAIKIDGVVSVEDEVSINGEYYPEDAFFWPAAVPVLGIDGERIGKVVLTRDGQLILAEGVINAEKLSLDGGWAPVIGYTRIEMDEILRAQIVEMQLTSSVDEYVRYYITE